MTTLLRAILCLALFACGLLAQRKADAEAEQRELSESLSEAGNSPVDFIRALEKHLAKYPQSAQRNDIERALAKAAIEAKDRNRTILYGEKLLSRDPDDAQMLERVALALLATDSKENAARALKYSKHFEEIARRVAAKPPEGQSDRDKGRLRDEVDRALGKALAFQARAQGLLGQLAEASSLAARSYESYPSVESARETGKWLDKAGKPAEAVIHYADAFALADRTTDGERVLDRIRMGELWRQTHPSEAGLGDVLLEAFDRTGALMDERRLRLRQLDPNSQQTDPMKFTITGVTGSRLDLKSLQGKVVIMDFWATWCGPCRGQHPLYEQVKERFKQNKDVVFLAIDTDEDRNLVEPFLRDQKWSPGPVYFEDGLQIVLRVSSIPTTLVFNRRGEIASRMAGYIPDRFVDMLSDRIRQALAE